MEQPAGVPPLPPEGSPDCSSGSAFTLLLHLAKALGEQLAVEATATTRFLVGWQAGIFAVIVAAGGIWLAPMLTGSAQPTEAPAVRQAPPESQPPDPSPPPAGTDTQLPTRQGEASSTPSPASPARVDQHPPTQPARGPARDSNRVRGSFILFVASWLVVVVTLFYLLIYACTAKQLSSDTARCAVLLGEAARYVSDALDQAALREAATEVRRWMPPWLWSGILPMGAVILVGAILGTTASFTYAGMLGASALWAVAASFVVFFGTVIAVHRIALLVGATVPTRRE